MSNSKWTLQVLEEIMVLRLLVQINRMVPQCYNVAVSCVARTHVPQLDHNHQRHQYHLCRSFGPGRLMMGCNYALDGFGRHSYPMCMNAATYLRHSSPVNAVVLGEACASEESDLVFPSDDFSSRALVPSHQKVSLLVALFFFFFWWRSCQVWILFHRGIISTWTCTKDPLRTPLGFGLILHHSSTGRRSGASKYYLRILMWEKEMSRLRSVIIS